MNSNDKFELLISSGYAVCAGAEIVSGVKKTIKETLFEQSACYPEKKTPMQIANERAFKCMEASLNHFGNAIHVRLKF